MADLDWALEADKIDQSIKQMTVKVPETSPDVDNSASLADASLLTKVLREKLVETKSLLEVQRADPSSPLYSVKSFEDLRLRKELLEGVYGMGFNKPSKIQEVALPILVADPPQNLIAQSQSGTGKTAAFVLSMLTRVDPSKKYPQVICLSPTFDLARQTGKVVEQMGKFLADVNLIYAVKGRRLERGQSVSEQIIIGTPGTVMDWVIKLRAFDPNKIVLFVLDEADVMIATQGHQDQTLRIHR
jgi:ATP-dependent RNA helicase DDX19/DBP5